ncbi:MAG: nickel-dependent hydrogenase large subunit [Chloroflexota bacterium]
MHRAATDETTFEVAGLTRVEGEGSLRLRVSEGRVTEAHLEIFEAPRYFERLVVGRTPDEVLDIVARICGICPVAYQMSAVHAFESLFGVHVDPVVRSLRRLMYCAEWIESHALHLYLLHLPDFLGYPSAVELAHDRRATVLDGLELKRIGNAILTTIGGRAIHPVTVRVGGFSRLPSREELGALRPGLVRAVELASASVDLVMGLTPPALDRTMPFVALRSATEYPMNEGRIVSTDGLDLPPTAWRDAFSEQQVPWSHALQARTADGRAYLLGPAARIVLSADQLGQPASVALARLGGPDRIARNPHWSIAARAVELVEATSEALAIVSAYVARSGHAAAVPWTPRAGVAAWSTEAPRGLLFHRYEMDANGRVLAAQIVPPTSQNQAAIEADLASFAPSVMGLPHDVATGLLEQLIRSYDPCISCATHFLRVQIEEGPA